MSDNAVFEFVAGPCGAWPVEADVFIPETGEFGHFRSRGGNTSLVITTELQSWSKEHVVAEFRIVLPTPADGYGNDAQWRLVSIVPTVIIEQLIAGWVGVHLASRRFAQALAAAED